MFARTVALVVSLAIASVAVAQMTWFVDDDAPPGGNGTSWVQPFKYLQDALAAAQPGDRIHVGAGTYYPDRDAANPNGTGNRKATFQLKPRVTLLGSFAGFGAPNPNQRLAPGTFPKTSILSGDLMQDDGPNFTNRSDNSIHVVTGTGGVVQGAQATGLDGFQISGGNANGAVPSQQRGGGYYMENGEVLMVACEFRDSQAFLGGGAGYVGGGRLSALACRFNVNKTASQGGALFLENATSSVILDDNSRAERNEAYWGGAVAAGGGARFEANNTFIALNMAEFGGAVYSETNATLRFEGSNIVQNTAVQEGGAFTR